MTENTQQTLIEVKSLDKKFGAIHAVRNLSFSVNKGEVLGFLGPNGAGKSTTMKMITGFLPEIDPWLEEAIDKASMRFFDKPAAHMGEGWSIPFMGMLGEKFPDAQFFITGVLGPGSNAHGPNEFLHIPMAKNLTACIASVIADHFNQ